MSDEVRIIERIAALEVRLQHVMEAIREADARQDERMRQLEERLVEQVRDHERRLRALERWLYRATGWVAAVASLVTLLWQLLLQWLGR